jgi:hypothetical protein
MHPTMHPTMPHIMHTILPFTHITPLHLTMPHIMHITPLHLTMHPTMPLTMPPIMHPTMLLRRIMPRPLYGVETGFVTTAKRVIRVQMIVLLEIATIVHIKTTMWHLGWNVPKIVITLDPGFHLKMRSVVVHSRIMQLRQHIIQVCIIHIVVVM